MHRRSFALIAILVVALLAGAGGVYAYDQGKEGQIGVDIDGSVQRALARSREGDMVSRTWRELRGTPILSDLDAKVTYSKAAIRKLVTRVQRDLAIEPVNASVDLDHGSVEPKPSKDGREVRAARLRRDLERELLDSGSHRRVRVRTNVV